MLADSLGLHQASSLDASSKTDSDCVHARSLTHPPNSPKRLRHRNLYLSWLGLAGGDTGQHGPRKRCLVEGVLQKPVLPDVEHADRQSITRLSPPPE